MKKVVWLVYVAEVLLFTLTTGALAYTAQNTQWVWFFALLAAGVLIFGVLKYIESEPTLRRLRKLEEREFSLARRFDSWGLRALFNMADPIELQARNAANVAIIRNGTRFSLLAESAASYFDPAVRRHWDEMKAKLEDGCPVRLLLVNPYCPAKAVRNERNGVVSSLDPKFKFHDIAKAAARYENIEIRFTDQVYCSLFFTECAMIYDPYHLGKLGDRIENYFLALEVETSASLSSRLYRILKDHFEYSWDSGMRLSEFMHKHGGALETETRELLTAAAER